MATLEEQVTTLTGLVGTLVAAQEAATAAGSEAVTVSESVSKAVDAIVAVEASEAPESFKATLRAEIKAGNYDVAGQLAAVEALRKEILAEAESGSTTSTSELSEDEKAALNTVNGW